MVHLLLSLSHISAWFSGGTKKKVSSWQQATHPRRRATLFGEWTNPLSLFQ
jgi:hypothetical protein